jgi:hypothetical protein
MAPEQNFLADVPGVAVLGTVSGRDCASNGCTSVGYNSQGDAVLGNESGEPFIIPADELDEVRLLLGTI